MQKSFIEFYGENKISPVRQDISNLGAHFARREGLYRHLGIISNCVTGKTVLEVGAGSGYNSLYTASLKPSRYVIVDGNPSGLEELKQNFANHASIAGEVEVHQVLLEQYSTEEQFDFVLCEGMLPGLPDPADALRRLERFVAPGGVLVITCIDHISFSAEILRRAMAYLILNGKQMSLSESVACLLPAFAPHLSTIKGMSRPHEDWILDNILNPAMIGRYFSIPEAVAVVDSDFSIYSTSPHFLTDWRWYKQITGTDDYENRSAVEQYWRNVHNFLDYEELNEPRSVKENQRLYEVCTAIKNIVYQFENSLDLSVLNTLREHTKELARETKSFSASLSEAFAEGADLLVSPLDAQQVGGSRKFGRLFGRGQQYVSFLKSR